MKFTVCALHPRDRRAAVDFFQARVDGVVSGKTRRLRGVVREDDQVRRHRRRRAVSFYAPLVVWIARPVTGVFPAEK